MHWPYDSSAVSFSYTINDGQGGSVAGSATLDITPVNDPPTLSLIGNQTIDEDAGPQNLPLAGITSGAANETQTLTVSAVSSNPALIPDPIVTYTSPDPNGTLTYVPNANSNG